MLKVGQTEMIPLYDPLLTDVKNHDAPDFIKSVNNNLVLYVHMLIGSKFRDNNL